MTFEFKNPNHLWGDAEARNARIFASAMKGRSMFGRIYLFDAPRGPSAFCSFDADHLVFRSVLTEELFHVLPKELDDKREIMSEMEVLAWSSK